MGDIYEITLFIFRRHNTIQIRNYSFSIIRVSIMQDPKQEVVRSFKIRPQEQVTSSSRRFLQLSPTRPITHSSPNKTEKAQQQHEQWQKSGLQRRATSGRPADNC